MEAIGAEKCERGVRSYAIEFLAPENVTLEAKAKVVVKGTADIGSVTLSLDGKDCWGGVIDDAPRPVAPASRPGRDAHGRRPLNGH